MIVRNEEYRRNAIVTDLTDPSSVAYDSIQFKVARRHYHGALIAKYQYEYNFIKWLIKRVNKTLNKNPDAIIKLKARTPLMPYFYNGRAESAWLARYKRTIDEHNCYENRDFHHQEIKTADGYEHWFFSKPKNSVEEMAVIGLMQCVDELNRIEIMAG
jgi:hypothetical protein